MVVYLFDRFSVQPCFSGPLPDVGCRSVGSRLPDSQLSLFIVCRLPWPNVSRSSPSVWPTVSLSVRCCHRRSSVVGPSFYHLSHLLSSGLCGLFELPMGGDGVVDGIIDLPRGKWYGDWDENTWILTLDAIERCQGSEASTENGRERSYDEEVIDACFLLWRHHGCSPRVFFIYSSSNGSISSSSRSLTCSSWTPWVIAILTRTRTTNHLRMSLN